MLWLRGRSERRSVTGGIPDQVTDFQGPTSFLTAIHAAEKGIRPSGFRLAPLTNLRTMDAGRNTLVAAS